MNNIMYYNGANTPYFRLQTTSGFTISTISNSRIVFKSFRQNRTVKKANTFELVFDYVPPTFSAIDTNFVHEQLLSSAGFLVNYEYGYSTHSGLMLQNVEYVGQFTNYTETINSTSITYTIKGIGCEVKKSSVECSVRKYLNSLVAANVPVKPSNIVRALIDGECPEMKEYFTHIDYSDISCRDDEIDPSLIDISCGTIHDVLMGTIGDNGKPYGGLVSYSQIGGSVGDLGSSSWSIQSLVNSAIYGNIGKTVPFIAYFDNIKKGGKDASFHYKELTEDTASPTAFTYIYGNSEKHSDVFSVNISYDCVVAMGIAASSETMKAGIDANGNMIAANSVLQQAQGFTKDAFVKLSDLYSNRHITGAELARALDFPFEIQITIAGQTELCSLLSRVALTVLINGSPHSVASGNYIVFEVNDEISSSGYKTSLTLFKETKAGSSLSEEASATLKTILSTNAENTERIINKQAQGFSYLTQ